MNDNDKRILRFIALEPRWKDYLIYAMKTGLNIKQPETSELKKLEKRGLIKKEDNIYYLTDKAKVNQLLEDIENKVRE